MCRTLKEKEIYTAVNRLPNEYDAYFIWGKFMTKPYQT